MSPRIVLLVVFLLLGLGAHTRQKRTPQSAPNSPASAEPTYRNSTFGFRYRTPYGWVERTKEMQEGTDASKGEVLLAVFEHPPEATADTINSAVVIAAENAASYPGLKKAEDYLGPLTELTTSKGFKAEGDPSETQIDSRTLIRVDFSKALNDKLTMRQSTLIMLAKSKIVSFTFIADSAEAIDELIERLGFSPAAARKN